MKHLILALAVLAGSLGQAPWASADQATDEPAIRQAVQAYVAAFNRGDAKALASFWSPEGVYTNPFSDEQVVGREQIEQQFAGIFADSPGSKLEAATESVQFVSPNVAVEQGTAKVIRPDQVPIESAYSAVYVKRDGQWLLDRVTEEESPETTSNYEHLKELAWMVGTWVDQDEQNRVETTCQWTKNQNFMTRSFTLSVRGRIEVAGMQIIGWDPVAKRIRSWVFDSDGSYGEGIWSRKDNTWYIQASGVLPDGSKSSSVNVIRYVDDNTFGWQSIDRYAGGELLPNVDEVLVVRETSAE